MECIYCAEEISSGVNFCKFCGEPQSNLCVGCRKELDEDGFFCSDCGRKKSDVQLHLPTSKTHF